MQFRKFFLCIFLITLTLSGCDASETKEIYSIHTPNSACIRSGYSLYENGLIYKNSGTAYFLDYHSFAATPLCNKPNCTHSTNSCIAQIVTNFGMNGTPPLVYQDQIYYFTESDEITEGENGQSTSYEIQCQLHKIDIANGEQTIVCTFNGMEATCSSTVYLEGNTLYFVANNGALQDDNGAWSYFSSAGSQYLCSVDLDSGTFTDYGQINDPAKVTTTLFAVNKSAFGLNGEVKINGFYDGKLWMSYYYADSSEALIEIYNETGDFPDFSNPVWHIETVTFDLTTKELVVSNQPAVAFVDEERYVYWNTDKEQYQINGKDGEIVLHEFPRASRLDIVHDHAFDALNPSLCYNLSTEKLENIAPEYVDQGAEIITYAENAYIIQYMDEDTNTTTFASVPASELFTE